jgi:glycosyltransferase involved in cell wall biosynthesis
VLITTDAVGGVWTHVLDLAAGLASLEFETMLVVMGPSPTDDQLRAASNTPHLDLIDTGLPLDWTATDAAEIAEARAAIRVLARRIAPDVIHLNSPALAADGGFPAPVVGGCHSCLATWWGAVKDGPMPPDFAWRTQALWRGLVACDALVAPTHAFAAAVARTYEVPVPFVVHNGRAAAPPYPACRDPLIFTSGRLWDEGKNVAVLDTAAERIATPFYAAGPVTGPNGVAPPATDNLLHLGVLTPEAVRTWLRRAAIYASSALYEPFGLGVLEAAQAGCALVLSDIATFRELWDGAAIFVEPRSPEAFATAFERLLSDGGQLQRLSAQAQARAHTFDTMRMARGVAEIYDQVLTTRRIVRRPEAAA